MVNRMSDGRLAGKRVFLTGAGGGLVAAIARAFAAEGATQVLAGRTLAKVEAVAGPLGAEAVADVVAAQVGPLFRQWKAGGQIFSDLNLRETVQWMSATTSFLLTSSWRHRPAAAKRRFVDRYLIRALVPPSK